VGRKCDRIEKLVISKCVAVLSYRLRVRPRSSPFACLVHSTSFNLYEVLIEVVFTSVSLPGRTLMLVFLSVHEAMIDSPKGNVAIT